MVIPGRTSTPAAQASELRQRLLSLVEDSAWLMPALQAVRELGLDSWCIGAGAVRNLVWDALHGFAVPSALPDIDVAYFDESCLSAERDRELQARLSMMVPGLAWEVTNQAAVHLWYESYFGHPVPAFGSLAEAVGSWPEYATAVGVSLAADGSLRVIAPHGLEDLFAIVVRHNPTRCGVATYLRRLMQKRYAERWPKVTVVPC